MVAIFSENTSESRRSTSSTGSSSNRGFRHVTFYGMMGFSSE